MRALPLAVPLLMVLPLALGSYEGCVPSTSDHWVEAAGFYLDVDCDQRSWCPVPWIYEESNGIAGLQRQDGMHDDTCDGQIPGDTLIF